ncbi:MAG: dTDP-4-dehydrorhamnose reductase [Thermoguttaceae bacterium]|jgi:dTDP-4-dehydrorhamnose reductase
MTEPGISDRILVTGAGGRLGSEIRRLFGARAAGVDLPELDLTDRESVRLAFSRCRPRLVINTAAYTEVDRAESEPELCWDVNVRGVERLVEACRDAGAGLVQISTDYVFDGRKTSAYVETDEPNPLSAYGRSKLEAERIAAELPNHLIVRTAGLFGPAGPASRGSFVETMLRLAECGKPIRVVSDRFASPTYTCDLARAIESLLRAGATGVYHVVNAGAATWHEMAVEILRLAGRHAVVEPVLCADHPSAAARPRFSALDTRKYDQTPGRFPMPRWNAALAAYLASGRDH